MWFIIYEAHCFYNSSVTSWRIEYIRKLYMITPQYLCSLFSLLFCLENSIQMHVLILLHLSLCYLVLLDINSDFTPHCLWFIFKHMLRMVTLFWLFLHLFLLLPTTFQMMKNFVRFFEWWRILNTLFMTCRIYNYSSSCCYSSSCSCCRCLNSCISVKNHKWKCVKVGHVVLLQLLLILLLFS